MGEKKNFGNALLCRTTPSKRGIPKINGPWIYLEQRCISRHLLKECPTPPSSVALHFIPPNKIFILS
jgi:hypothetical protein